MENIKVAVTSPSFSRNESLTKELCTIFPDVSLNQSHAHMKGDELYAFLQHATAAIIGLEPIDADLLAACPKLQFISKYGVGLDNIDMEACKKANVQIGWTGGTNKRSVSELALGMFLGHCRKIFYTSTQLRDLNAIKFGGFQITGKTIGIIGVGHVGKDVIELLAPFKCKILVNDILDQTEYYESKAVTAVTKEEIYQSSDIISLHTPLTDDTYHMINQKSLRLCKPHALIVNTARGELIDIQAAKEALFQNQIGGLALDVFPEEPPTDKELLNHDNMIATPHIGGSAEEAILAMGRSAIDNLKLFSEGKL